MPKRTHHDIMLSSSFKDLEKHRDVVIDAITRLGFFPQAMELDSALPDDIIYASLDKVRSSDAYIGIIGYRYGQVLDSPKNPDKLSVTELEYNEARKLKLPICMFVMSDVHPVPRVAVSQDSAEQQALLKAFVERVAKDGVRAEFDSVDDLKPKVIQSLTVIRERLDGGTPAAALKPLLARSH